MSNSANGHRKSGRKIPPPRREPAMEPNLICFLEARGIYQRGRHAVDFRNAKNRLDAKRAA